MVSGQANSSFIRHAHLNHISLTIFVIPGTFEIPHGYRIHRRAVVWPHRSACRWYSRHSRSIVLILRQCNAGVLADNSKSRFGRRRPFMIGGAIITAVATALFGFTRPVAGMFSEEGSMLVSPPGMHQMSGSNLIAYIVQVNVNMARHNCHLCHGFLNKCRHVSWDS